GLVGLESVAHESRCEYAEAKREEPTGIEPSLHLRRDRCRSQLRDAAHEHNRADLERRVIAHEAQEERHQIDGAVEARAGDEAVGASDAEIAVAEMPARYQGIPTNKITPDRDEAARNAGKR